MAIRRRDNQSHEMFDINPEERIYTIKTVVHFSKILRTIMSTMSIMII